MPGEYENELPNIGILTPNYLKTLDGNGGMTPPLVGGMRIAAYILSKNCGAF